MLGRTSVRSLTTLALIAMLVFAVGLLTQGTAQAQPVPDETVPTNAEVPTGTLPPRIECKWELPDMVSTSPTDGIQYVDAAGNHDDDMAVTPGSGPVPCALAPAPSTEPPTMADGVHHMIQVKPNLEDKPEERRIQLWTAADDPTGIDNIIDVFWDVFEPAVSPGVCNPPATLVDGLCKKAQVHGTKVTLAQCQNHLSNYLGSGTGPDSSMFNAAVETGQMTGAAVDDINRGMIAKCLEREKALYYSEFSLSKEQPCGTYMIKLTVTSSGGFDTLTNYIDVLCVSALQIDFNTVDWGTITPGITDMVSGNLEWDNPPDNHPTVKNVGNDGMGLQIHFSQMDGASLKGHITSFDACFGRSPATILCRNPIAASTWVGFGTDAQQVLCANEIGKLDLSIHPPSPLAPDIYSGTFDILGVHVADECNGDTHIP